ncbi:MAG: hypothetical protein AB7E24_13265 [Novosphingobium sp.]
MIHADNALIAFMFDVAGGAFLRLGMELRGLLVSEIRHRMTAEARLAFDTLQRRMTGRALGSEGLVRARQRAWRHETLNQAGTRRSAGTGRNGGDHGEQRHNEHRKKSLAPDHSQRNPK